MISRLVVLILGTLYPAYQSYKAVKRRDPKEYVKWMMYWIVFALFSCFETVADIFASILPLYYEFKICFILWLISPWTKGSTYLYRKFVHPTLSKRESEIDEYINHASTKGYEALKKVGTDGLTIAASVMVNSAMKGQTTLLDHLKNYSALQKSAVPELQQPIQEEDTTDGRDNLQYSDAYDAEYIPSSEEDTDDYQQPSADMRGQVMPAEVRGPMVQSMYEMDNRFMEDQEVYETAEPVMFESYQDPQSSSRARRRRLISAERQYLDSEGSEENFEDVKRHSLRRSTSMRSQIGIGRHPSTEDLMYSKTKFASTENIPIRRSTRRKEMMERAARHRTKEGRPASSYNPKV